MHQPPDSGFQHPPKVVPFSKPWHTAKIVLLSISLVICIILLGLAGSLYATGYSLYTDCSYSTYCSSYAYVGFAALSILWVGPVAGVALIWDIAEFITICARRSHRGIHPGAHVALHLLIWLGCGVAFGLTVTFVAAEGGFNNMYSSSTSSYSTYQNVKMATVAFLAILLLMHFTLFVRACVETQRRNSTGNVIIMQSGSAPPHQQQVFYYPGVGGAMPMQFVSPLQQHKQQHKQQQQQQQTHYGHVPAQFGATSLTSPPPIEGKLGGQYHGVPSPTTA